MFDVPCSRREFGSTVVGAAAIALLPSSLTQTDEKPRGFEEPAAGDHLSEMDSNQVRARYSNLLGVYGSRLSADEKRRAMNILVVNEQMLAAVRLFVTQNADPSACTLRLISK
jgi:hypothetical protein